MSKGNDSVRSGQSDANNGYGVKPQGSTSHAAYQNYLKGYHGSKK